jgi:hypothetical protein
MLRELADVTGQFGCPACGDPMWPGVRLSRWNW